MATITTPRPPLNLFEVVRLDITDAWTTIYDVPNYLIPANGPNPARSVNAAAIMTGLVIVGHVNDIRTVAIRILKADNTSVMFAEGVKVPAGDNLVMSLDRQVLLTGERIQAQVIGAGLSVPIHFSFILNQREEFEVIT